jgi:hypothetical protein
MNDTTKEKYIQYISYLFLSICIAIGIYIRFKGIGKWSLAVDEYYIGKSVKNILGSGLPELECGGYYTRGLLYQYISAGLIQIFNRDELILRCIPVISNLLAIPPIYWIAKRLGGISVAVVSVILFSLSIWEIEFSRFARMYAPFQMIFIWYCYFFLRIIIEKDLECQKWVLLLSLVAIFVYEGSILLLFLNFITIIAGVESRKRYITAMIVLFILGYAFLSYDFRHLGTASEIDLNGIKSTGRIILPKIFFLVAFKNPAWAILFFFPVILFIFLVYHICKITSLNAFEKLSTIAVCILTFFNLFSLAFFVIFILLLLERINLKKFDKISVLLLGATIFLNLFLWLIYGLASDDWLYHWGLTEENRLKNIFKILFMYPHIYDNILREWLKAIPKTTVIMLICTVAMTITAMRNSSMSNYGIKIFVSIIAILGLIIGALNTPYDTTRYTFFMYPILLIILACALKAFAEYIKYKKVSEKFFFLLLVCGFMFVSDDYSYAHLKEIDSIKINFRLIYDRHKASHYYVRTDYKTPAEIINDNYEEGQLIISTVRPVEYYLKKIDFLYQDRDELKGTSIHIGCSGKNDIWTSAPIIYNESELYKIIKTQERIVWLIAPSETAHSRREKRIGKKIYQNFSQYKFGQSIDKKINLYKIILQQT